MSSKSAAKGFTGKSPYGDSSRRGRGGFLLATVVIVLLAALAWTAQYTHNIGASTQNPDPKHSADPVQTATEAQPTHR